MKLITNFLFLLQKFVTKNQKYVRWLFCFADLSLLAVFVLTLIFKDLQIYWFNLGSKTANLSLILFWLTLIPGILKRFELVGIFLPIRIILMLFRKELGILMFLSAITHYAWSRLLPIYSIGGNLLNFNLFEFFGLIAIILAFPMFITSNDFSINHFGNIWKKIHSMAYVIIWLLFLHVVIREPGIKALITLIIASLEWASLVNKKFS